MKAMRMDNIKLTISQNSKYDNQWKTINTHCNCKEMYYPGEGLGAITYCWYNKKQKAKCNDRLCPKMKYALVKQGMEE